MKINKLLTHLKSVTNIRLYLYYSLIIYLIIDCVNSSDPRSDESQDSLSQRHHRLGHHIHRSHNRHKLRHKSTESLSMSQTARNRREFKSSLFMSEKDWPQRHSAATHPLSMLYNDLPLNKTSRKRNNSAKPPNIIFILTDDQDIELGSMNFMPKASKIMAEEGVHFPNAYVTTPMCCPSRSSSLTGLYVHNHNIYTNNDNCSSPQWQSTHETRTFASYLNNAGYRTGKPFDQITASNSNLTIAFFGKYLNEYNGSYIPPGWKEWSALVRNSRFYNYTLNVNGNKVKHGNDYNLDYFPDLITNDSLQFLRYSKRFFANKPLLMVLAFPGPHGPEDSAPQFQHMFLNVTTHRTPSWNYAPNPDKQWILRNTGKMEPIHEQFTDMLHTKRLQTLQSVDDSVERLYNELKELGELDNTYIFYTSDHGYHLGQFGLVKGKAMPFEFDVRVPFFVRGPKLPGGHKVSDIVLNIDLAPTFLDIAGVKVPELMDGNSVLPLLKRLTEVDRPEGDKQKIEWRHTFLIERGRYSKETDRQVTSLTKRQWLSLECQKPEYRFPCSPYQRFECFFDGYEMRIRKCRKSYWSKAFQRKLRQKCICPSDQSTEAELDLSSDDLTTDDLETQNFKRRKLDSNEKKLQRRFLKEHVFSKEFRPVFIGSRSKRDLDLFMNDGFDVDGVYELNKLLQESTANRSNDSGTHIGVQSLEEKNNTLCVRAANESISCSNEVYNNKQVWRQKKNRLDSIIKNLQNKLFELKGIRRHLNMKRPLLQGLTSDGFECDCNPNKNDMNRRDGYFKRRFSTKRKRMRFLDRHRIRKEKKLRRKSKFLNTTCNYEKMNCFTHDNDHWKTAPLWTMYERNAGFGTEAGDPSNADDAYDASALPSMQSMEPLIAIKTKQWKGSRKEFED